MNYSSRVILPLGALVLFAGLLFAADTIELKDRLVAGKKYYWTERTVQTSAMAEETGKQSSSTTLETSEEVRAPGDGKGKRVTLKYDRIAMDDPVGSMTGKELHILLNEKNEITEFENYDEFIKSRAMPSMNLTTTFSREAMMFSKESITQMMKEHGHMDTPDHPLKPGDSWPISSNVEHPPMLKRVAGNYTFKGMVEHDGVQLAEINVDAKISVDFSGLGVPGADAAKGLGMKIENGSLKGTIWFDPKLGLARETQMTEEMTQKMTLKMRDPAKADQTISTAIKATTDTKLTKIEDLK
jgi:hypothetical protein